MAQKLLIGLLQMAQAAKEKEEKELAAAAKKAEEKKSALYLSLKERDELLGMRR
jgi:hypothetical protein